MSADKSTPERIYVYDIPSERGWTGDRMLDTDVEYVRASSVDALREASQALYDALAPEYHDDGRVACFSSPNEIRTILPDLRTALAPFTEEEK